MLLTFENADRIGLPVSVPVAPFVSRAFFEHEREKLFPNCWLMVGSVQEIPENGDFVTRDIDVLSLSALIVRGRDGVIRAFHNVCTHRGNQIAFEKSGNARAFVCGVHSWTFGLDGSLRGVPPHLKFCDLDKSTAGLKALGVGIWNGFIFIHPHPDVAISFDEYLGPLKETPGDHPIAGWERYGRYSSVTKTNWKTFQVAFMESSHVKTVHPRSVGDYAAEVIPPDFSTLGQHGRMTFYMNMHHSPYPVELAALSHAGGFLSNVGVGGFPGLNPRKAENFAFDLFVVFPNFLLFLADGWATTHVFWPLDDGTTYWESCYYAAGDASPSERAGHHYFALKVRDTVREDLHAVEAMQRGMRSGALTDMPLCQDELLIAYHLRIVNDYLAGQPPTAPA